MIHRDWRGPSRASFTSWHIVRPSLARGALTATWRASDQRFKFKETVDRVDMSSITHHLSLDLSLSEARMASASLCAASWNWFEWVLDGGLRVGNLLIFRCSYTSCPTSAQHYFLVVGSWFSVSWCNVRLISLASQYCRSIWISNRSRGHNFYKGWYPALVHLWVSKHQTDRVGSGNLEAKYHALWSCAMPPALDCDPGCRW